MDDAHRLALRILLAWRVIEAFAELAADEGGQLWRQHLLEASAPVLYLEEILAPDELHRDEVALADAAELEDLADVRVRQLARDLRLVDEHRDEVAVLRHRGQDP